MSAESQICFSSQTGEALKEYYSKSQAQLAANESRRYGKNLVPYMCQKCTYWHLSPVSRQTSSTKCSCTGSNGRPKARYLTETSAKMRANILYKEKDVSLKKYHCLSCNGWHLTKG